MKITSVLLGAAFAGSMLSIMMTDASAAVVFDSQALAAPYCGSGGYCVNEQRPSYGNYAAVLEFSANVKVNQIGVYSSVDDAQNVKFVIFDSLLNGGTGNLLFSETKAYPVTSARFLTTGPISFTFQAGHTYDVGILGDGAYLTGSWIAYQNLTSGPITEIANNANISNFLSPVTGGYAGVSPYVQLSAVPETSTWVMMLAGFAALGFAGYRRNKAATLAA